MIGIIRTAGAEEAVRAARAVVARGIDVLEVALTTPDGIEAIKELRDQDVLLGAGGHRDGSRLRRPGAPRGGHPD